MSWANWTRDHDFTVAQIEAVKMMMIRDMPSAEFLENNPGDRPQADKVYRAFDKLDEATSILKEPTP